MVVVLLEIFSVDRDAISSSKRDPGTALGSFSASGSVQEFCL